MSTRSSLTGTNAQRSFIESKPDKPSPSSSLYTRRFTTSHNDGTQSHIVVGVHVVLAKGHSNGLWEALSVDRAFQKIDGNNPRVATRALTICCDTLEVQGEFSVPEAAVEIYARRLVWADAAAAINTSPLPWTTAKARNAAGGQAGQSGAEGRPAGSLQVFVDESGPLNGPQPRLVANGGQGQDPGAGQDGIGGDWMNSYASYLFSIVDSGVSTSKKKLSFSPPAVYIEYEWRWSFHRTWGPGYLGENRFPKDGTNALAPGAPGNGGNAGMLTTNLAALTESFQHNPGNPGTRERDYRGGSAGVPSSCAKYKVKLWQNLTGTKNASHELTKTDKKTTKRGADSPGRAASRGAGANPAPVVIDSKTAWLHPLSLQTTLEYARDLFLAGGREELLSLLDDYQDALAQSPPSTGGWPATPASQWTAAQIEVATLRQRLNAQLDYFGHPAGYTPLLSLPGSIKLYANETKRALGMMILTGWIADTTRDLHETVAGATEALTVISEDNRQAADQVAAGEAKIAQVRGLSEAIRQDLTALGNRLVALRNELLVKAVNDKERQAAIKFSIKMAGALCQVIPVGQPALGTIGSLGAAAADFVGGDPDQAPDTLSKMGDILTKANTAAEKGREAAEKAKKEQTVRPAKDAAEGMTQASAWAAVGKGLGPAVSDMADAVKALQVPQAEIDAELARLKSEDSEWNALTREICALNEKKVALFQGLGDAIQAVGEGFARLSANAGAVVALQQQREKALGKVDPQAVYVASQLGQRSRLTLQKYLYLMVKAYESTLLKPLSVDWTLATVTAKINELLQPGAGFTVDKLDAHCDALDVLFQQNLAAVREQLLTEFDLRERTHTLKLGLSARQTPEPLAVLNETGRVVLDPQVHGLLLPNEHLARLSGMALSKLSFDPAGPPLPDTTNVVVSVVPAATGTMRRDEGLYVLASDVPVRWGWTYLGPDDVRPSTPSTTATDVIDFILGEGSERIGQKVSLPPAWSDLAVSIEFSPPIAKDCRPRISDLYFEIGIDSSPAPDFQRVLSVRSLGTSGGAVIKFTPLDLAQRGDGGGNVIRIYSKGQSVTLAAPDHAGGAAFEGWEVNGVRILPTTPPPLSVEVKLDDFVFAASQWVRSAERDGRPVVLSRVIDAETLGQIAAEHPDPAVRTALKRSTMLRSADPVRRPIHVEPQVTAPRIGFIPGDGIPDDLGERQGEWRLVNYQGVVGWTSS